MHAGLRRERRQLLGVAPQLGVPLAAVAMHVPKEVLKAPAGGPAVEDSDRRNLMPGSAMPFTESGGAVAVAFQDFRNGRRVLFPDAVVARIASTAKRAPTYAVLITAGQQ